MDSFEEVEKWPSQIHDMLPRMYILEHNFISLRAKGDAQTLAGPPDVERTDVITVVYAHLHQTASDDQSLFEFARWHTKVSQFVEEYSSVDYNAKIFRYLIP